MADAIDGISTSLTRLEKKVDKHIFLQGERHVVSNERLAALERLFKLANKSLEGLTAVVKTNNELARQSHHHTVTDFGLLKGRVAKLETDAEVKKERTAAKGSTEKL